MRTSWSSAFRSEKSELPGTFNSAVSSNAMAHVPDGTLEEVVRGMHILFVPQGGYAIHWVPAFEGIFGSLDQAFGHYRMYSKAEGQRLFQSR